MRQLQLICLQIKVNFNFSALKWYYRNDIKKFMWRMGIVALAAISISPVILLYSRLIQDMFNEGSMLGQPEIVLASALVLSSAIVFMLGIIFIMSVFYFSEDLSFLVPLPFSPKDILGAKFIVVLLYNYLIILPFFLPALWVYGSNTEPRFPYWLIGAFIYLLVPIIPLAIASVFVVILMHITIFSKMKDTLRIIGLLLFIFIFLTINFFAATIPTGEEAAFVEKLLSDEQGLVNHLSGVYPPVQYATQALTSRGWEGFLNFTYFLVLNLIGVASMLFVGQKLFFKGLIGGDEVFRGKAITREDLESKTNRANSFVWAIAMREIKHLVRTPIYLLNSLAMLAIVPLLFLFPVLSGRSMDHMIKALQEMEPRVVQILAGALFIVVMSLFVSAASSSFSREGKLFWLSQVIPVPPQKQIQGKILYCFMLTALILPIVTLMSIFIITWSLIELLIVLGSGLLMCFPAITLSLFIDLLHPYLTWDSPQKAIKQNINVILAMIASGGLYYLLYLAGRIVYVTTNTEFLVYLVVLGGAALSGAVFYGVMMKMAPALYNKVNVE